MSGSSHGTCGGPDRDCQTRSKSAPPPRTELGDQPRRLAVLRAVQPVALGPGRVVHRHRDRVRGEHQPGFVPGSAGNVASAARTPSTFAAMNPGWSK